MISYLDGRRLGRVFRSGLASLIDDQDHLNRINVYPVADGDTGTNLKLTAESILPVVHQIDDAHAGRLLIRIADAALDGARGNSGAIIAQFLQGLADHCESKSRLDAATLSAACESAARFAREAMSTPVEGTILTVLTDFATALVSQTAAGNKNIASMFRHAHSVAAQSLENTPNLLDALRKADVVDAGAAGFMDFLDGVAQLLESGVEPTIKSDISDAEDKDDEVTAGAEMDLLYRYCTECLVSAPQIDRRKLREQLSSSGDSLVIAGSHSKMRVHIHSNDPAQVFRLAAQFGTVSGQKADDMQSQQELSHVSERRTVIATDTAADVPDAEIERLNIYLTPVRVHFGDESYLDKVTITAEELYQKLRQPGVVATTSQPAPGDFRRQFQFLKSHYRDVVSIHVSGRVSGTFQAACKVAAAIDGGKNFHVLDSATASVGQALLVIDAAEAAMNGMSGAEIAQRFETMKTRTQTYCVLRELGYGVRGGRVSPRVKTIADLFGLTPVLKIRKGQVKPAGVFLGRDNIVEKFARYLSRRCSASKNYRIGIGHADCKDDAIRLAALLREAIPNGQQTIFSRLGTALGVHTGPQGLVVGIQDYGSDAIRPD
ncbi:MAG: DegV family EDD domain-containing protein, partial [Gammaproteobacteria bacterium]|nr:DegV family EDD domain-containing protein [Gammaproteobacteria bacterium]